MDENMALFMDKLKELVPFAKEREQELTSDIKNQSWLYFLSKAEFEITRSKMPCL